MLASFKDFIENLIFEELHPELQEIAASKGTFYRPKQNLLANKIKELVNRGERTGLEGNMPKGSSRAYLLHDEPKNIMLDGKSANIKIGTKVAIRAQLDKHHEAHRHNNLFLGAMQNEAENSDYFVNKNYRILTENAPGNYESNEDRGIFPPLIDHDDMRHEYSQVGHSRDIGTGEFQELTKHPNFPKGITHKDFCDTLERDYQRNVGRYWEESPRRESQLDKVEQHPLVQKFLDYHRSTGHPPHDYRQKRNLGVFEHPNGSKHIVARDHGFSTNVAEAYRDARMAQFRQNR